MDLPRRSNSELLDFYYLSDARECNLCDQSRRREVTRHDLFALRVKSWDMKSWTAPFRIIYWGQRTEMRSRECITLFALLIGMSMWQSPDRMPSYPSLSPYSYVANNPLKYSDPDGNRIVIASKSSVSFKMMSAVLSGI